MNLQDKVYRLSITIPDSDLCIAINDVATNVPISEFFLGEALVSFKSVRGFSYFSKWVLMKGYLKASGGDEERICFYSPTLKSLVLIDRILNPILQKEDKKDSEENYDQRFVENLEAVRQSLQVKEEKKEEIKEEVIIADEEQKPADAIINFDFIYNQQVDNFILSKSKRIYAKLRDRKNSPQHKKFIGEIDGFKYILFVYDNEEERRYHTYLVIIDNDNIATPYTEYYGDEVLFYYCGSDRTISTVENKPIEGQPALTDIENQDLKEVEQALNDTPERRQLIKYILNNQSKTSYNWDEDDLKEMDNEQLQNEKNNIEEIIKAVS